LQNNCIDSRLVKSDLISKGNSVKNIFDSLENKGLEGNFAENNTILQDNHPEGCLAKKFPIYLKVKLLSENERRADVLRNNPKMYKVSNKVSNKVSKVSIDTIARVPVTS